MGRHLSRKLQRLTAGKKTNLRSLRHERCEDQILHSGINAPIRFQMHIGFLRMILARPKSSTLATSVYRCVCPRCRGAIAGGGERPKLEGSYQRCSEPAWHRPGFNTFLGKLHSSRPAYGQASLALPGQQMGFTWPGFARQGCQKSRVTFFALLWSCGPREVRMRSQVAVRLQQP